jgi:hypothetical protein
MVATTVRTVAGPALFCIVLAACGGGGHKTTAGSGTTVPARSSTAVPVTTTPPPAGSTAGVSVDARHPTAHLTAVRAARQDSGDRVVFEFSDRVPGYRVGYASGPVTNTEGKEVAVAGQARLVVRMEAATGAETYSGPGRVSGAGTTAVTEVARVEDFEGVLSWVIGAKGEAPFRVTTLESPPRVVIDVTP